MSKVDDPANLVRELEDEIRFAWRNLHDARRRAAGSSDLFDKRWVSRCRERLMDMLDLRRSGISSASRRRPVTRWSQSLS